MMRLVAKTDGDEQQAAADASPRAPVMILSFRHRDSLADEITGLGHRVVAARRVDGIGRRFLSLDCRLVIIDARHAAIDALKAAERLAPLVRSVGGQLLLLYDRADSEYLPAFVQSGIGAILAGPWQPVELEGAITLASMERPIQPFVPNSGAHGWWQADAASHAVTIDPASDDRLRDSFVDPASLRQVAIALAPDDRKRAFGAMRKLRCRCRANFASTALSVTAAWWRTRRAP